MRRSHVLFSGPEASSHMNSSAGFIIITSAFRFSIHTTIKCSGSAAWNGGLREGKGSVSTESRALETYPYTFFSRYGEKLGTNPEELLGAAHAACFTMSFVRLLGMANFA